MQIRRRRSSFWRVWGTALVSVGALVVIAAAAALMMFAASAADAQEIPGSVSRGSRDMRVTERFSRIDAENLRYEFTVDDPAYETAWSGEYPWPATSHRLYEYACHEGNYSFGNIMRGARLLEREAANESPPGASTGSGSGD